MSETQTKTEKQRSFKNMSIRFSIRMTYVLPPLDTIELIDILVRTGYIRTAPPAPSGRQRGVQFAFTGSIARKGDTIVDVNDERGVIGISSPSPASTIQGFNEVFQLIKSNLKVDPESMASFYEFIGQCEVESEHNPLEKIGQISEKVRAVEEFGKVIGKNASLFSLRLAPKGETPNQTRWFDITIEPHLIHTTSVYTISVVYRSPDKPEVQKFVEEYLANITKILDIIENP
jgi:hypothetical protein